MQSLLNPQTKIPSIALDISNVMPQDGDQYGWSSDPDTNPSNSFKQGPENQTVEYLNNTNSVTISLTVKRNGCEVMIRKTITKEDEEWDERGTELPDDAVVLLRKRYAALRDQLDELGTDAALAQSEGFKMTQALLSFHGGTMELNDRFADTMDKLIAFEKRARAGSPRESKLLQLMAIAAMFFMDQQVAASPQVLDPSVLETLKSRLPAMQEAGFDTKALSASWKSNELRKVLPAPSALSFNKMLK